ncbi:hypothetical protein [Deinococcus sp. SL84]|uniref:hypothetical protein n=1 Tax=Deinococcus sp. SL84 TaxID=2994663 RepID=UPI00227614EE|nr:hypothetical protein [Deinococcus sp. SL84]MCY1702195.1 hypothetical protein [Deinococcus sp. SL84]
MQKKYAVLALSLTAALSACGGGTPPKPAPEVPGVEMVTLTGAVAEGRAQEAADGAAVTVKGGGTAQTDADGRFTVTAPKGLTEVTISKAGHASTRVVGLNTAETTELEEILRPVFDATATTKAPEISLTVLRGDPANPDAWKPVAPGETVNTFGSDVTFGVTVKVDRPEMNTFKTGIASIEVAGGTSGYLNAGMVRELYGDPRSQTTSLTFTAAELAAFQGKVNLHVVAYDLNGNRVHLIQPLNVTSEKNMAAVVAPTKVMPRAVTYGDNLTFGPQSLTPAQQARLSAQVQSLGLQALGLGDSLTPQAAPRDASLWVDVRFEYPAEAKPRAFELWRSFDGTTYSKVFSAAPSAVAAGTGRYLMRDTSPQLTAGRQTHYKVLAVSDAGSAESASASVTPLGRYTVQLNSPAQAQTGVSLTPTFTWTGTGQSDRTLTSVIVTDRVQAESYTTTWRSKTVPNGQSAVYNFDGSALTPTLQPNHAYEWQVASVTMNGDGSAVAIAADYFNVFGLFASPSQSVRSAPVSEFVTGGTQ